MISSTAAPKSSWHLAAREMRSDRAMGLLSVDAWESKAGTDPLIDSNHGGFRHIEQAWIAQSPFDAVVSIADDDFAFVGVQLGGIE